MDGRTDGMKRTRRKLDERKGEKIKQTSFGTRDRFRLGMQTVNIVESEDGFVSHNWHLFKNRDKDVARLAAYFVVLKSICLISASYARCDSAVHGMDISPSIRDLYKCMYVQNQIKYTHTHTTSMRFSFYNSQKSFSSDSCGPCFPIWQQRDDKKEK